MVPRMGGATAGCGGHAPPRPTFVSNTAAFVNLALYKIVDVARINARLGDCGCLFSLLGENSIG